MGCILLKRLFFRQLECRLLICMPAGDSACDSRDLFLQGHSRKSSGLCPHRWAVFDQDYPCLMRALSRVHCFVGAIVSVACVTFAVPRGVCVRACVCLCMPVHLSWRAEECQPRANLWAIRVGAVKARNAPFPFLLCFQVESPSTCNTTSSASRRSKNA